MSLGSEEVDTGHESSETDQRYGFEDWEEIVNQLVTSARLVAFGTVGSVNFIRQHPRTEDPEVVEEYGQGVV